MTKPNKTSPERSFVAARLPWILGAGALLVYLLTFNHWVSLNNLSAVSRSAGWLWGPELTLPLFYVLTFPFRWLPPETVPWAHNLFSVACGSLALALLARAVALLPRDRTHDQRLREKGRVPLLSGPLAWIPPVFAVVVCGLQLTVWENSTTGSSDVLDLLLLAYVVRNLLEYRISENDSWLLRAALVMGLGMANNWPLFVLFPGFVVAVVWIKGFEFFQPRFFMRMIACGIAGMLLYLLLPAIHVLSSAPLYNFWNALKVNLTADKQAFMHFMGGGRPSVLALLAFTSLLPVLIIGIRWPSNFGDPSRMGSMITRWIFHCAHGALLLFCLWLALDPVFSPRRLGYSMSVLVYLSALSVGYLTGYFLLVSRPVVDRMGRSSPMQGVLHKVTIGTVAALLVITGAGLCVRNLPQIRMTNGPALREYAAELVRDLPENAVVLSDDARRTYLAQAAVARAPGKRLFIDTQLLTVPGYHGALKQRYGEAWPEVVKPQSKEEVKPGVMINIMHRLSEARPVRYLHYSFGYYFEMFDRRPHGITMELVRFTTNSPYISPVTGEEIAANEQFWTSHQAALDRLVPFIAPPAASTNKSFSDVLRNKLQLRFQPNATAVVLGSYYSQVQNAWGVNLQRANRVREAEGHFKSALRLFPDNLAAEKNLAFNADLQAGRPAELRPPKSMEEELGRYRSWEQVMRDTGPFDDPTLSFVIGMGFAQGNNFRQATHAVERVYQVLPGNLQVAFWLSRLYVITQQPARASELLAVLRQRQAELAELGIRKIDMLQAEAGALYVSGRREQADQLVRDSLKQNPTDLQTITTALEISKVFRSYTNAMLSINQLLEVRPDNISALVTKGVFQIQAGEFQAALEPLNKALSLQSTNYGAQLYRAMALLNVNQLDAAAKDYTQLSKVFPNSIDVHTGLAELAVRRKDTNTALQHLEFCLRNTPVDSQQAHLLSRRISELRPPSPSPAASP